MPTPDDLQGGITDADKAIFNDEGLSADVPGEVVYAGGAFSFRDAVGTYDPRAGGGISATQHKGLRHLVHFLDEGPAEGFASGAFREALPIASPFPTSIIWWESSAKLQKIAELTILRNPNRTPSTETWTMYDADGVTVLVTLVDSIIYAGVFETSRTRAIV